MNNSRFFKGYYALRWEVLERDNFTCQYCGQQAPNVKLEVDHKTPVEEGGATTKENLITSCYACNRGRSGLSIRRRRGGKQRPARPYIEPVFVQIAPTQTRVLKIIKEYPAGIDCRTLSKRVNLSTDYTRVIAARLIAKGSVKRIGVGGYAPCPVIIRRENNEDNSS